MPTTYRNFENATGTKMAATLDLSEAAALLRMHSSTLRQAAKAGLIPGAKIGRAWVFVEVDLLNYIRCRYPDSWRAQSEEQTCHSESVETSGGLASPGQAARELDKALAQAIGRPRRNKRSKVVWSNSRIRAPTTVTCS